MPRSKNTREQKVPELIMQKVICRIEIAERCRFRVRVQVSIQVRVRVTCSLG